MEKFIINIFIFICVFFVFDKLFLTVPYISAEKEIDKRLELVLNGEMNKDVIVLGSSRGARDIIASVIEDKTGLTCYNLSYPGSNIEFHEFILRKLLKHNHPPKLLILTIDDMATFKPYNSIVFRYDRLYPLIRYDEILNELILKGEKDVFLSKLFVSCRLSNSNFDLRQKRFSSLDTIQDCGSMPISFQKKETEFNYATTDKLYSKQGEAKNLIEAYENIIELCRKNNITLLNVFPPNYSEKNFSFEKRLKEIDVQHQFYNYSNNPVYKKSSFFYDGSHLKINGARIFTRELSDFVNHEISDKARTDNVLYNSLQ